jgi:hypothetical protein
MNVSLIYIVNKEINISNQLNEFKILLKKCKYEIILVENNLNINLNKYYESDLEHIKIINLSKTYSYKMALMAGINKAKGNTIISLSNDYNYNIKMMEDYLNDLNNGMEQIVIYNESKKDFLHHEINTIGSWIMQDNVKNALKYLYERKENIDFKKIGFNTKAIIDENINIKENESQENYYLIRKQIGFEESIL